jgi:hypothetical protein
VAERQDLRLEFSASSEAGPHGGNEGSDARVHIGARYQERAISSIATRSTEFPVGTGLVSRSPATGAASDLQRVGCP